MPNHSFILNGKQVIGRVPSDVRLLWVLRDLLGVTRTEVRLRARCLQGMHVPHQRQGVQPVLGPGRRSSRRRRDHHDRGARRDASARSTRCSRRGSTYDVGQCGYCQPGQIMDAVALVERGPRRRAAAINDAVLDEIRNDLPLRHLPADPRGDSAGCAGDGPPRAPQGPQAAPPAQAPAPARPQAFVGRGLSIGAERPAPAAPRASAAGRRRPCSAPARIDGRP